ncbi:hypothetical protein QWA68_012713 [Fusarium oxysporum]|nr:hypothetical protein QWA68_012713 [Fusarium oxysporum]
MTEKFLAAKAAFDEIPIGNAGDKTYAATLIATFPDEAERREFFQFLANEGSAQHKVNEAKITKRPLSVAEYINTVTGVDWSSAESVSSAHNKLYGFGQHYAADKVFLGHDNKIYYYLQPEKPFVDAENDLNPDVDAHAYVLEMRSEDGQQPPFQYGYCLGSLKYVYLSRNNEATASPHSTPFHVYLDVSGKGVWIVMVADFQNENGDTVPLDRQSIAWDHLPSPQNSRDLFKVMKVSDLDKLQSVPLDHSFFNGRAQSMTFDGLLKPWMAAQSDVTRAAGRGGGPSSSG